MDWLDWCDLLTSAICIAGICGVSTWAALWGVRDRLDKLVGKQ